MTPRLPGSIPLKAIPATAVYSGDKGGPRSPAATQVHEPGRRCRICECNLSRYNPDDVCAPCVKRLPIDERPKLPKGHQS